MPGGNDTNPMFNKDAKLLHDTKMRSKETRDKISKTLSERRRLLGFTPDHKQKIKAARAKRLAERKALGLTFYEHPEHMASRSIKVYCILNTGETFYFDSILDAGRWWYDRFKPFGEVYSTATYQRKIEASIAGKEITFGNKVTTKYKIITNIKWFCNSQNDKKGGDAIYE